MAIEKYTLVVEEDHFKTKSSQNQLQDFSVVKCLVVVTLLTLLLVFVLVNHNPIYPTYHLLDPTQITRLSSPNKTKIILGWTHWFTPSIARVFDLSACPHLNCRIVSDRDLLNQSDAIVFHIRNLDPKAVPDYREPWQRYVFLLHESPLHTWFDFRTMPPNFFNWTMTYRADSDVFHPYGFISRVDQITYGLTHHVHNIMSNDTDLHGVVANKTRLALWIASNCKTESKRELVIEAMKRELDVDVWGGCGNASACPRNESMRCDEILDKDYKFVLAFENSMCVDYVTEKLWSRVHLNVVPIVLKRSTVAAFVPANAFIAVDDYVTLMEFINDIRRLDSDTQAYSAYLYAKYQPNLIKPYVVQSDTGFCGLCAKLWNISEPIKFYSDVNSWWSRGACESRSMHSRWLLYNRTHAFPNRIKSARPL